MKKLMREESIMSDDNNLAITEAKISCRGLIELYEWCARRLDLPTDDSVEAIAVVVNEMLLADQYRKIRKKLWDERSHPKWKDWRRVTCGLRDKYGDRDNMGRLITDEDGAAVITENLAEYKKELEALKNGEFKDLIEKIETEKPKNEEILSSPAVVKICSIQDWSCCPKGVTPRILGMLMAKRVNSLLRND